MHKQSRSKRRRNSLIVMGLGLLLVIGAEGFYLFKGGSTHHSPSARPAVDSGQIPVAVPTSSPPGVKLSLGIDPTSVEIPSLSINASVVPVDVSQGGVLGVPSNPLTVGWWSGGPKPGAAVGTAILTSHVNWDGVAGAFANLGQVKVGAQVVVKSALSSQDFTVTAIRVYQKADLPAQTVFSQAVAGRLVLITCGGPFDPRTGHYEDNIVAYAVPAASTSS